MDLQIAATRDRYIAPVTDHNADHRAAGADDRAAAALHRRVTGGAALNNFLCRRRSPSCCWPCRLPRLAPFHHCWNRADRRAASTDFLIRENVELCLEAHIRINGCAARDVIARAERGAPQIKAPDRRTDVSAAE